MTMAEIRGKIGRSGSNLNNQMEDLLTSDVFTSCRYLRPETLLIPFLNSAKGLDGYAMPSLDVSSISAVEYHFWPLLQLSEPDLVLDIRLHDGKHVIVLIEAKFMSPKSNRKFDDEEYTLQNASFDQLAREYEDLLRAHEHLRFDGGSVVNHILIYITAHRSMPRECLHESWNEIRSSSGCEDPKIYWTNWFQLLPIIKTVSDMEWERPILDDLTLLLRKKGLTYFDGFSIEEVDVMVEGSLYRGEGS